MQSVGNSELLHVLLRIEMKMNELVTLLKISQTNSIESTKEKLLSSPVRKAVYSLCDGAKTVSEISKILGKSMPMISQTLAKLVDAGLVIEERKGKQRIYRKVV